jgi:hypothetical protein
MAAATNGVLRVSGILLRAAVPSFIGKNSFRVYSTKGKEVPQPASLEDAYVILEFENSSSISI